MFDAQTQSQLLFLAILFIPLGLVFANRLRMDVAALLIAVLLAIFQRLGWNFLGDWHTPQNALRAFAGFAQPVVLTLIGLFILTRALDVSGVTRRLAGLLMQTGGGGVARQVLLLAGMTAALSLVMNNLAAVALTLPAAMEVARRTGIRPSKLLIPVAYGSLLGGAATYFTTANIIVSDLLGVANPPQPVLGVLDFPLSGGFMLLAGLAFMGLVGHRLLPERDPSATQSLFRLTGTELEDIYSIPERLWEAHVPFGSALDGRTLGQSQIGALWGVTVAGIHRGGEWLTADASVQILPADSLLLVGRASRVEGLRALGLRPEPVTGEDHLTPRGLTLAEVLLPPHSQAEGRSLKEMGFRQRSGLTVIALRRADRTYRTEVGDLRMKGGDALLVLGPSQSLHQLGRSADFVVLEPNPADLPLDRRAALISGGVMLAAIIASALGVPAYLSMIAGAVMVLLLKQVTMEQAYRAIEWQAVFLIAGMYGASMALTQTGLAQVAGDAMVRVTAGAGGLGLAAGAFLLSMLLTQIMGSQVTALVTGPIAITAALSTGVSAPAVAMAAALGCSASFLTPMAHPANILMVVPGNYRAADFLRIGLPLTGVTFLAALLALKVVWGL